MWTIVRRATATLMNQNPKAIVTNGKRDTVVALLGWAGAADKNVAKYSDIYQKMGYTTVQYTPVPVPIGWGTKEAREVTNLAKSLDSVLIRPSHRLVFHVFSMNGFLTLTALDCQFPELKVIEKCDGLFLDSCPACFSGFSIDNVRSHALVMDKVYDGLIKESNVLSSNAYRLYKKYQTARFGYRLLMDTVQVRLGVCSIEQASPYHYLLNHDHLPSVISSVFSDADIVCDASQIDSFSTLASSRTDRHRQITTLRLSDSAHVEHFRKYPKLYVQRIIDFLENVRKFQNGGGGGVSKL